MGKRQISFFIDSKLWEEFSIKAIKEKKSKTQILVKLIEDYIKKK